MSNTTTTTKDHPPPPQQPPVPPQQQPRPPPPSQRFLLQPQQQQQQQQNLISQFQKHSSPSNILHYPLASSGRGFIPSHHRPVPVPVPGLGPGSNYPVLPISNHTPRPHPTTTHVVPFPFLNQTPLSMPPSTAASVTAAVAATVVGSGGAQFSNVQHSLSKVGSSPYANPESNAPKDLIDKKPDDSLVAVRERKVRVSDGASLYALCRSWLRNGYPEDKQPQYGDVLNSLPKPLPLPETSSPKRKEPEDETNFDEVETDDLNAEELLARHVKRAKRVRARLREERSRRIEKYKSRLALLLPPNGTIQE